MTSVSSHRLVFGWLVLLVVGFLSACSKDIPRYVPPAERPLAAFNKPWLPDHFLTLCYHDVEDEYPDQTYLSVRSDHLVEQLAWLHENGYQAVTVDQVLDAQAGRRALPEKSVLLTFDDGYRSFYTRVLPILKAWNWPAVLAPVGVWMDTPENQPVDFGGQLTERERFLNWQQVAEIARSGLVEIAAHTDHSHYGIIANPQGNTQPAAANRAFDSKLGRYETDAELNARMKADVVAITEKIRRVTGKKPRVWVWPYGAASGTTLRIVAEDGYQVAMVLDDGLSKLGELMSASRVMPANAPGLQEFARSNVIEAETAPLMRVAHVDLDYVYDPDPVQTNRNLDQLVQRIFDMQITTVFLQAFADPQADGLVRSVYFPNRHLPMRADLFNRVAWQLRNRAQVEVYAWMPVLSISLDPRLPRVQKIDAQTGAVTTDKNQYQRLSPFDARVRQQIGELYEDLAGYATFDGILFHDDALLGDYEDASPAALAVYQQAGFASITNIHSNFRQMQAWTRFKSRYLTRFTQELAEKVRAIRGPQIKTARNIYALPILEPKSEAWFAQNLDDFLSAYDWVAPMAMPRMENVHRSEENAWLDRLVDSVAKRPGALDKTVFELQAFDWRRSDGSGDKPISSKVLAGWMQRLQLRGARNFGYYPDDFSSNHPDLKIIRSVISSAWYPFY